MTTLKLALWERAQLYLIMANQAGVADYVRQVGKILAALEPDEKDREPWSWQVGIIHGRILGVSVKPDFGDYTAEIDLPDDLWRLLLEATATWDRWPTSPGTAYLLDKLDDFRLLINK